VAEATTEKSMSSPYQPSGGIFSISEHDSSHNGSESVISDLSNSQDQSYRNNDAGDDDADDRIHTNPLNNQISILRRTTTSAGAGAGASSSQEYWKSIEEVIESIPVGAFHSRILWICGVAFMADGMVCFSFPIPSHPHRSLGIVIACFRCHLC
jgi:hypothetical protein